MCLRVCALFTSYSISRHIHGYNLSSIEKRPEFLVVIWKAVIRKDFLCTKYSYKVPGVDGSPETMEDIFEHGFYIWDTNCLQHKP